MSATVVEVQEHQLDLAGSPSRASWTCDFAINGRFLSQRTTGVQRYAREVTRAIDRQLYQSNGRGQILAPAMVPPMDGLKALTATALAPLGGGHAWEQLVLATRHSGPLLNLCNTAPAFKQRQVVCIHDANIYTRPESYSSSFRRAYRALLPLLARRAAQVTSVSAFSATQLARHLPIAARDIVILPNGHEHALRWNAAASRLKDEFADRRPFVLLLGSRALHKNADLILRQAEALEALGLDLVVAGGEAGIFAGHAVSSHANVVRLGAVSDDDLALLFSRALCLAFPSFTEGFGLPIVEAMALGCPVVSSDAASMPEVCGSAALMASPEDGVAWRQHFERLARSAELRENLRGLGLERVRRFTWVGSAAGYLSLFERAVRL